MVYGWPSVTNTWLNGWASAKHARFKDGILDVFWLALCRARMVKMVGPLKARMGYGWPSVKHAWLNGWPAVKHACFIAGPL